MHETAFLAYIDPASGTLILQAVIAAVVGSVAFFRRGLWTFLRRALRFGRTEATPPDEPPPSRD